LLNPRRGNFHIVGFTPYTTHIRIGRLPQSLGTAARAALEHLFQLGPGRLNCSPVSMTFPDHTGVQDGRAELS